MKQYITEPAIHVGILLQEKVFFSLYGNYQFNGQQYVGEKCVSIRDGKIELDGSLYDSILFTASSDSDYFDLLDVTIGIHFHWERKETQRFNGDLKLIVINNKIQAINCISVEKYLTSVISSEMSATSSMELLKAHAVISRSWLLNKLEDKKEKSSNGMILSDDIIIKWYDHQDHTLFDVCADDHCQRYQGISKASTQAVRDAIKITFGQVLTYDNEICDARFYKSCGGATELFENCWEEVHHPYLLPIADRENSAILPDLTKEEEAEKWILSEPEAYCNTKDKKILTQVLNNYDQETADFYRWKITYTQQELSLLLKEKTGIDFGSIIDLIPVKRGASGRIIELKIIGTNKTMIIGKELEIRKALSKSHLYSSAFIVKKSILNDEIIFTLHGAGWGHGVGLCQIGAAVMADQGISYKDILLHYYPNSSITSLYKLTEQ